MVTLMPPVGWTRFQSTGSIDNPAAGPYTPDASRGQLQPSEHSQAPMALTDATCVRHISAWGFKKVS